MWSHGSDKYIFFLKLPYTLRTYFEQQGIKILKYFNNVINAFLEYVTGMQFQNFIMSFLPYILMLFTVETKKSSAASRIFSEM